MEKDATGEELSPRAMIEYGAPLLMRLQHRTKAAPSANSFSAPRKTFPFSGTANPARERFAAARNFRPRLFALTASELESIPPLARRLQIPWPP